MANSKFIATRDRFAKRSIRSRSNSEPPRPRGEAIATKMSRRVPAAKGLQRERAAASPRRSDIKLTTRRPLPLDVMKRGAQIFFLPNPANAAAFRPPTFAMLLLFEPLRQQPFNQSATNFRIAVRRCQQMDVIDLGRRHVMLPAKFETNLRQS